MVAVTKVDDTAFTLVAAVVPKVTAVAPDRSVPMIVAVPPPVSGDESGVIDVIVGAVGEVEATVSDAVASMQVLLVELVVPLGQLVPFPLKNPSGFAS